MKLNSSGSDLLEREISLTVAEASRVLRVSPNTVYRMVQRGELKCVRLGRRMFIPSKEVERLFG
jgi:excisionase family DNA binding protein